MRATRDLLRRRMYLMHHRAEALAHIVNTASQYNLPAISKKLIYAANRAGIAEGFADPSVRLSVEADLRLVDHFDEELRGLELQLSRTAKVDDPQSYYLLQSVPGIGKILALVLLYEIHDVRRFPKAGNFLSYARLVKCAHESAGKRLGTGGKKIGNAHLKWAFSEATVLLMRQLPAAKEYVAALARKHGKGKALSILSARLGRTVYLMLKRKEPFEAKRFLKLYYFRTCAPRSQTPNCNTTGTSEPEAINSLGLPSTASRFGRLSPMGPDHLRLIGQRCASAADNTLAS
jgi:hypothetical protein